MDSVVDTVERPLESQRANVAGDDAAARADWSALLTGAVATAAPNRARMRISGEDAQRWLNAMVTNNTAGLARDEGNYSFLLSNQGRIQGDLLAFRMDDGYVLDTEAAQAETIAAWLDRYIIMDDVTLTPETEKSATVIVAGATAAELLEQMGMAAGALPAMRLLRARIAGCDVEIFRDSAYALPAFWIWCAANDVSTILTELHARGARACSPQAMRTLRIASGVPKFDTDITSRDLPQETSQARALHFQKGCYLGQEIVERIHSRGNVHRGLTGFILPAGAPAGTPVMDGDTEIGTLTSVATLPAADSGSDRVIALGIVRLAAVAARKPLMAAGAQATAVTLPFLSPISTERSTAGA